MRVSAHRLWAMTLLPGCFADPPLASSTSGGTGSGTDVQDGGATTDPATTSSHDATLGSADGSDVETGGSTSTSGTTTTGIATSGESGMPAEGFCDAQRPAAVMCRDFDGAGALAGGALSESNGTVTITEEHAVSPPRSMRASIETVESGSANASLGQPLLGADLPFAGRLSAQVWIHDDCVAGSPERLVLALQFADALAPDGPFFLNLTLWATADTVILYESDAAMGYPSVPHVLPLAAPTQTWVDIEIVFAADSPTVVVTVDGSSEVVGLDLLTAEVMDEIAGIVPTFVAGTSMGPGLPDCTIDYDDLLVTSDG